MDHASSDPNQSSAVIGRLLAEIDQVFEDCRVTLLDPGNFSRTELLRHVHVMMTMIYTDVQPWSIQGMQPGRQRMTVFVEDLIPVRAISCDKSAPG